MATEFEGGASESFTAASYDVKGRKPLHDSDACDSFDDGDVSGVREVVFFKNGGMAYSCGELRIADGNGDRALEPAGTAVSELAVVGGGVRQRPAPLLDGHGQQRRTLKSLDL